MFSSCPPLKVLIFVEDDDGGLVTAQLQNEFEDATPSRKVLHPDVHAGPNETPLPAALADSIPASHRMR